MTLHPTQTQCSVSGLSGAFPERWEGDWGRRNGGGFDQNTKYAWEKLLNNQIFLKFKNKRNITTSAAAGLRRGEKKVTGSLTVFIPKDALPRGSPVIFNTSKLG